MEVAEQNGRFRAGDDENDEDQEEESVHVVDLRRPVVVQLKNKKEYSNNARPL